MCVHVRAVSIMLKILPIIRSQTSYIILILFPNHHLLFLLIILLLRTTLYKMVYTCIYNCCITIMMYVVYMNISLQY